MNNIITVAPDIDHAAVLDAEFVPATDEDLIRKDKFLWAKLTSEDYAYSSGENCHSLAREALKVRCSSAREYREKKREDRNEKSRKLTAFVQRLLAGSILFLLWAVSLALLVG